MHRNNEKPSYDRRHPGMIQGVISNRGKKANEKVKGSDSNPFCPPPAHIQQKKVAGRHIVFPSSASSNSLPSTPTYSSNAMALANHTDSGSGDMEVGSNLAIASNEQHMKHLAPPAMQLPLIHSTSNVNMAQECLQQVDSSLSSNMSILTGNTSSEQRTSKDYYFDSYSHHGIHEEMLKDEVRTKTYQAAILKNRHIFKDKVVLDVGCGTGILSMFAAQAGAKHVYGVDSSGIIEQARHIVARNGFQARISLIHGKIEEVELPVQSVDIIISEWMGYFLLYESMLDTVLFARDKWLTKDPKSPGVIFPDKAVMFIGAIENTTDGIKSDRVDFWKNVYGFDMSPIKDIAIQEPIVDIVSPKAVISDCTPILTLDLLKCTKENLTFKSRFCLEASRNDYLSGFVSYFEVGFTQIHKPIGFSTAPFSKYTHW
eukprot:CAMPEP_0116070094 /NCGR_PEP_ID=MMETSP0322-20121206/12779_1 /TAXON_ID=163516 /ORGANISM="Leptocylindrus danicus var. apora, Strain B651" /LENGTH=428 /DNA_ID=CAMNT_0003557785 /DNA_START=437 /DNA_END=1720 /DNA_ORIENTATION=+